MTVFCCFSYEIFGFCLLGKIPVTKEEPKGHKLWRCSICTYDNEDSFSACDICGVLRIPLDNNINTKDDRTGT